VVRREPSLRDPASPANGPADPAPGPTGLHRLAPGRAVRIPGGEEAWRCEATLPAPPGAERIPEETLFLDLETTGLGSFPLFLAGLLSRRGPFLALRQVLARTYAEEGAVISLFLSEARGAAALVSYNGRSFDLPCLRARAATCGVAFRLDLPHRDLLPECRRAFRPTLPDCRLTTLEHRVLGRLRHDDLPGSEVPAAYHAFVRTGDARDLARVLAHNRDDLTALFSLAVLLPETPPAPVRPSDTCPPSAPPRGRIPRQSPSNAGGRTRVSHTGH
jgi:hypothetical protein